MQDETPFFSVAYRLSVNAYPLPMDAVLPDEIAFLDEIPESFRLAAQQTSDVPGLGRALQSLGDAGEVLQLYLRGLSQKIDMLQSHLLSLQDDEKARSDTSHFGGSSVRFFWPAALEIGQLVRLKLFVPEESAAVYCYAQVSGVTPEDDARQAIECDYVRIREEDRETLVRASLHVQSKLLQARAQARRENH